MIKFGFSSIGRQQVKKFYKQATVKQIEENKYIINLDNRVLKTPNHNIVLTQTELLAQAICNEFNNQQQMINFATLPLFGMCRTANDAQNDIIVQQFLQDKIMQFFLNDTIFYREEPQTKLGKIQQRNLDSVIDYMNLILQSNLKPQFGLDCQQNYDSITENKLKQIIKQLDCFQMTALEMLASIFKSTSIGLMALDNTITIQKAIDLSMIEENYQIEKFGFVEGSHDIDIAYIKMMSYTSKIFFKLSQ